MLQINFIRNNKELVLERLAVKNFKEINLIEEAIALDDSRKKNQTSLDDANAQINNLSKEIGKLFSQGKKEEAEAMKSKTVSLKEDSKKFTEYLNEVEKELQNVLIKIPNLPHVSVPKGKTPAENEIVYASPTAPLQRRGGGEWEELLPHWELASKYNLIDFELGNKLTGAGFPVYRGKGAKLQRALISFFLDEAITAGFEEVIPPLLVNEDSGFGTGQLPDKEGQMYFVTEDKFYLIPTAEVPVTNIFRDVILKEDDLPKKLVAYTPCFRREAGSYGKDVRGLNRIHQFDKVEIVQVQHPDTSYDILEEMVKHVESLLKNLELPYRILKLCGGDMSFNSALTYDMEVYSAGQQKWLEVSSVSNFESFQANRMKLRYKDRNGKINLAHTLNGSALALPRIVASLLENNQTEDGIMIPEVLRRYTGFEKI